MFNESKPICFGTYKFCTILIDGKEVPAPSPSVDLSPGMEEKELRPVKFHKLTPGMLTYEDRPNPEIFPSFSIDVTVSERELDTLRGLLSKNPIPTPNSMDNIKRMHRQYRHSNPSKYYINRKHKNNV